MPADVGSNTGCGTWTPMLKSEQQNGQEVGQLSFLVRSESSNRHEMHRNHSPTPMFINYHAEQALVVLYVVSEAPKTV
jgi:hypothetical protein